MEEKIEDKKEESEDFEIKSSFLGSPKEWLGLIKTIIAIANTCGGNVEIKELKGVNPKEFDTARIDDKVNTYISPRIHNIITKNNMGTLKVLVPNSPAKPHIFIKTGGYANPSPPPNNIFEFYEGQIWVRHSGKNEKATKDDFDRMFREKLDEFLKSINVIASQFPISTKELRVIEGGNNNEAIPIYIKENGTGLPVLLKKERTDPNIDYPYNARELGKILNRGRNFIAKVASTLGLRGDMKYAVQLKNPQGKVIMVKYSPEALAFLKKFLSDNPSYNPFKEGKVELLKKANFKEGDELVAEAKKGEIKLRRKY